MLQGIRRKVGIMILYFLRHGLAGDRDAWQGDDLERPLTEKGVLQMKRTAKAFKNMGVKVDAIITSPLKRAVQTAQIVGKIFEMEVTQDERLAYGFGVEALSLLIAENPQAKGLMLVGHEPDFSNTVSALTGAGDILMKKGGLARVDLKEGPELRGQLVWLLPPKASIL
jgi:phosphohistidine phosphatase